MIDWKEYKQADRVVVRYFNDDELVGKQVIYRPTPTKTVADAVEKCNHEWVSAENEYVKGASICTKCKAIAETATIEQEGEKWTHTWKGDKCYVVHIEDSAAWVVLQNAGGKIIPTNSLTPIKPTMTKDEQEAIAKFIARIWEKDNPDLRVEFDAFCKEYNIT